MSKRVDGRLHFYLIAFEFALVGGGLARGSTRMGWPDKRVGNARMEEAERGLAETIRGDGREIENAVALSVSYLGHMTPEEMGQ